MKTSLMPVLALVALAPMAQAQNWARAYESGLAAARKGEWNPARDAFRRVANLRGGDASGPINLPGPPTERRQWRNGAPYSPNFLAAYSLYRVALTEKDDARASDLATAANEFEALLQRGQHSVETYFYLSQIYQSTANSEKRIALEERFQKNQTKLTWRVDTEIVDPQELAAIQSYAPSGVASQSPNQQKTGPNSTNTVTVRPEDLAPGGGIPKTSPLTPGRVATVASKFALIVGNSESRMGKGIEFASDDTQRLREALVTNGGYAEGNIELVINGTADQIAATAKALASRVPSDGTVLIYFTGVGVNVDGKDYLAGVDTEAASDTTTMIGKMDLFQPFMARGAHIFSFFQANRPVEDGRYFGSEIPMVGSIAQSQATLPGETVTATIENGKTIGMFTSAFVEVLRDLKSNKIPVLEFGWQVFYKIRRGNTGTTGGGSRQTPTLPVLTNLASDAGF